MKVSPAKVSQSAAGFCILRLVPESVLSLLDSSIYRFRRATPMPHRIRNLFNRVRAGPSRRRANEGTPGDSRPGSGHSSLSGSTVFSQNERQTADVQIRGRDGSRGRNTSPRPASQASSRSGYTVDFGDNTRLEGWFDAGVARAGQWQNQAVGKRMPVEQFIDSLVKTRQKLGTAQKRAFDAGILHGLGPTVQALAQQALRKPIPGGQQ